MRSSVIFSFRHVLLEDRIQDEFGKARSNHGGLKNAYIISVVTPEGN